MAPMNTPSALTLNKIADRWVAKQPGAADRISRALALVDNVRKANSTTFYVEGSQGHKYVVLVDRTKRTSTCSCPDFQSRGVRCKHIFAAALYEAGSTAEEV